MEFCTYCGEKVMDSDIRCGRCNSDIQRERYYPTPTTTFNKFTPPVPTRSYLNYLLPLIITIIFLTVSVGALFLTSFYPPEILLISPFLFVAATASLHIYYYRNFDDFRKMIWRYHSGSPVDPPNPWIMLGVMMVFSPAFFYYKYNQLYEHITKVHRQTHDLPPEPQRYLLAIVSSVIGSSSLVILGMVTELFLLSVLAAPVLIGFSIYLYYLEYQWQEVFNRHVLAHEKMY